MALHNSTKFSAPDQRYTKIKPPWETGEIIGKGVKPIELSEKDLRLRQAELMEKLAQRLDDAGIKGISFEDCVKGRGRIEHITSDELLGKKKITSAPKTNRYTWDSPVGFGKYKDLTYRELRDEQRGYFDWAMENIDWFAERIEKMKEEEK